ncbi:hypothetical protein HAX54_020504 [Datura stramonium]|uniref:C2 domain-containing protein n=1 Tax=Datura stramonium TaxID=4076 RepID=A0ABS8UU13_DATST|nr:hypothetical protein [Datura stramonium]
MSAHTSIQDNNTGPVQWKVPQVQYLLPVKSALTTTLQSKLDDDLKEVTSTTVAATIGLMSSVLKKTISFIELGVEVVGAHNLLSKDGQGSSSSFVELHFDGQKFRTTIKEKDLNFCFEETFYFNASDPNITCSNKT